MRASSRPIGAAWVTAGFWVLMMGMSLGFSVGVTGKHREMLRERTERQRWQELQPAEAAQTQEKPEADQPASKTDTWDDQDYEYFFGDYLDDGYRPRTPTEVKELPPIENTLSTSSSLTDHLEWQLSLQAADATLLLEAARHATSTVMVLGWTLRRTRTRKVSCTSACSSFVRISTVRSGRSGSASTEDRMARSRGSSWRSKAANSAR